MSGVTKLILVEGFPGSGKSTTAQWLARQWHLAGRACRWFYEQQPDHPVVGIPAGADYKTWEEYFAYRRERWMAFTAETARGDVLIVMESALLQYSIFVTLRHGVAAEVIVAFLRSVADIIRPLAPGELGRWVGRYRVVWKGEVRESTVSVKDGHLIIDGLLWPGNSLRWKGDNVFDAESWPLEVVFESVAEDGVGRLSVRGPSCATP